MTESVEIGMARMQEQLKAVLEDTAEARQSRKEQYKRIDEIGREVTDMGHRLKVVENQLSTAAPTIAEFVVMKHRIQGAGAAGKWLWAAGGFLIASAASIVGFGQVIKNWFTGN